MKIPEFNAPGAHYESGVLQASQPVSLLNPELGNVTTSRIALNGSASTM